ncbi:MAG: GldG family protein, partial [Candidatus Omnitrophica bacterium]|nr:GldG family protein [Candidatus Omnitrophota bacterium]
MYNKKGKKISILFGLSVSCLSFGFGSFYINQHLNLLSVVFLLLGTISLFVCFVSFYKISKIPLNLLKWKKILRIVLMFLFLLGFLIGINYLAYHLPWRWDVTKAKQHTLSQETKEFLGELKQDVQLTAFYVGIPPKYLEDLFNEYKRASKGKIKIEIIDQIQQIGYAAQFGNVISGKERKVIVRSGEERRDIDFTETNLTEEKVTNAIVRVIRKKRNIYFITGHEEYDILDEGANGLKNWVKLLSANNVSCKNLMLGIEEDIPEDCDVLVIAGPKNHLTEKEEKVIDQYLEKGGDALFLVEHVIVTTTDKPLTDDEKTKNPSLNNILNKWGITVGDDIVVDLSSHAGQDVGSPATKNYLPHKAITQGLDYTFYVRPRSISLLPNRRPTILVAPIVLTSVKDVSWAESNRNLDVKFNETEDIPG